MSVPPFACVCASARCTLASLGYPLEPVQETNKLHFNGRNINFPQDGELIIAVEPQHLTPVKRRRVSLLRCKIGRCDSKRSMREGDRRFDLSARCQRPSKGLLSRAVTRLLSTLKGFWPLCDKNDIKYWHVVTNVVPLHFGGNRAAAFMRNLGTRRRNPPQHFSSSLCYFEAISSYLWHVLRLRQWWRKASAAAAQRQRVSSPDSPAV